MNSSEPAKIESAKDFRLLAKDEAHLHATARHRVIERGDFSVLIFRRHEAPVLFHELCRQREIAFRLSGQGSGSALDVTPEDDCYEQMVLWDRKNHAIAGAYRLGFAEEILNSRGIDGLYLRHMFDFDPEFFKRDPQALELTRSFVSPAYQKNNIALALLWRGLGHIVVHRGINRMFGSVTIAADFAEPSRALITGWLARHRMHRPAPLARALRPYPPGDDPILAAGGTIDILKPRIFDRRGSRKALPPLLRHYLPLGASFHAFHREASFGDALYCLLDVAVSTIPPAHRRRFLPEPSQGEGGRR